MATGRRQANLDEDGGSPFKRDDESFHSDMSGRGAEVEFVVKDVEATDYDLPFPKMVYAHEKDYEDNGLIKEVEQAALAGCFFSCAQRGKISYSFY